MIKIINDNRYEEVTYIYIFENKCFIVDPGVNTKKIIKEVKIIHTPGHTKGSACFLIENTLFSGDTLFRGTYGRVDLPTGNARDMVTSLKKLKQLDSNIIVYPGHGEFTTIESEC